MTLIHVAGYAVGQMVKVEGEETIGRVVGHTKKGRWDYVAVQVGANDKHLYRPGALVPAEPSQVKPAPRGRPTKADDSAEVAKFIGLDLDHSYTECARATGLSEVWLRKRYTGMNPGIQKMNLTNRIRAVYRKQASNG